MTLHGHMAKVVTKLRPELESVCPGATFSGFTSGSDGMQSCHPHQVRVGSEDQKSCLIQLGVPIAQHETWNFIDTNRHVLHRGGLQRSGGE